MDILSALFGSEARIKIMRLFLFNGEGLFDLTDICLKSKVNSRVAKKELNTLEKAKLIKRKSFYKISQKKNGKKIVEIKKRTEGFFLNQEFKYMEPLKALLISTNILNGEKIVSKLSKAGKLKMVVVAGVFIQDNESRLDMMVVGNNLSKGVLNNVIKEIEAEIGKELIYSYFEQPDFQYRLGMYDKLIRDVLDYPHKVLLDKMSIN